MTSLYSAPLEYRINKYKIDSKIFQNDIDRDYLLNHQLLYDERMQVNMYEAFATNKEILKKVEDKQKHLTGTEQMYLQYPEEKKKARDLMYFAPNLLENKTIPRLPPSTTKYLSPNIIAALEGESKQSQSPKTRSAPPTPAIKTPITSLANQSVSLASIDKNSDIYKAFRNLPRAKKSGLPSKADMITFAQVNGLTTISPLTDAKVKELAETILHQMPKIDKTKEGSGLLKKYRKKYKR